MPKGFWQATNIPQQTYRKRSSGTVVLEYLRGGIRIRLWWFKGYNPSSVLPLALFP